MNSSDHVDQIDRLSAWLNAVLDYLLSHEPDSISSRHFNSLLPQLIEDRDLQGLKDVFADLREFVSLLPVEYHVDLDQYLRARIGRGLFSELRNQNKRIALVLRRGRIADDEEYRALLERVNDTSKTGKKTEAINRLLYEYDRSRSA